MHRLLQKPKCVLSGSAAGSVNVRLLRVIRIVDNEFKSHMATSKSNMDGNSTTTTKPMYSREDVPYRSSIAPRNLVISRIRTSCVGHGSGSGPRGARGVDIDRSRDIPASVYSSNAVQVAGVKSSTDRETNDMQVYRDR